MGTKKGIVKIEKSRRKQQTCLFYGIRQNMPVLRKNRRLNVSAKRKKHTHPLKGDGKIRVERSTKGRKGKGVTLVTGLPLENNALKELAKKLKQKCGTGGTVKNGIIEIQGDHRDLLTEHLNSLGYNAKKAGG